ncbi:MAG TPA: efflux RND transporter periplasmic adaptor subunit [Vicinamibacterales bacterium]
MRSRRLVSVLSAGILVIALVVWLRMGVGEEAVGARELVTVAPRSFTATVSALGAVKPQIGAEVRVGSRISGRVWRLRANIGDRVGKHQIIAELETAELDALIDQRQAELKLGEAKLAAFDTLTPQELARAQADVARFAAEAKLASEEWGRQQTLAQRLLAPQAAADAARDRHLAAQAQLESALRALELVRSGNAEGRKQAEADVERVRAALESAVVERSFTVLRSPIDGIVASVSTQEGETVAAGLSAPTFVTVVDLDRLQLNAYVDEVDIGKIAPGQSARFTVDAFPARDFTGRVAAIYPTATIQDNVVKYVVAVEIETGYGGLLRPEMTANVRIQLDERPVLAVPARAIRRVDGRSVVYIQVGNSIEARPVRAGLRDGSWVEIAQGLVAGDRVLVDPPEVPEEVVR